MWAGVRCTTRFSASLAAYLKYFARFRNGILLWRSDALHHLLKRSPQGRRHLSMGALNGRKMFATAFPIISLTENESNSLPRQHERSQAAIRWSRTQERFRLGRPTQGL